MLEALSLTRTSPRRPWKLQQSEDFMISSRPHPCRSTGGIGDTNDIFGCGTNNAQKVPEDYASQIPNVQAQIIQSHLNHDLAKFEVTIMKQPCISVWFSVVPTRYKAVGVSRIKQT